MAIVVVHFHDVDFVKDSRCLPTTCECLHAETGCIESMDDGWSDGTCYLWIRLVKCLELVLGGLTPATVTLLIEREVIVSQKYSWENTKTITPPVSI